MRYIEVLSSDANQLSFETEQKRDFEILAKRNVIESQRKRGGKNFCRTWPSLFKSETIQEECRGLILSRFFIIAFYHEVVHLRAASIILCCVFFPFDRIASACVYLLERISKPQWMSILFLLFCLHISFPF